MIKTIQTICSETGQPIPETEIEITRCILDSLAMRYKEVVNELREIASFEIDTLYVIGGGAKNKLLNRLTAEATGLKVITGNTEATAMGNIFLQIQTKTLKQI